MARGLGEHQCTELIELLPYEVDLGDVSIALVVDVSQQRFYLGFETTHLGFQLADGHGVLMATGVDRDPQAFDLFICVDENRQELLDRPRILDLQLLEAVREVDQAAQIMLAADLLPEQAISNQRFVLQVMVAGHDYAVAHISVGVRTLVPERYRFTLDKPNRPDRQHPQQEMPIR